ncbi:MAG: ADP-ribosylglycohydrolase family protein [Planctomycetota bacterium]
MDAAVAERVRRVVGCIVGGAVGDAVGGRAEGSLGGHSANPLQLGELEISDDTQFTLATIEALLAGDDGVRVTVDPERLAATFATWHRARRFRGVGSSTLKALTELEAGVHWSFVGAKGERAAGNGAAMRAAPLAFVLDPDVDADRALLRDCCRITHHNDEAYVGALAMVRAIRLAHAGEARGGAGDLQRVAEPLPDSLVRDRLLELARLPIWSGYTEAVAIAGTSGWVADSVPLALFAASRADTTPESFDAMLETIVAHGGDTDTIASMAGQVLGARGGVGCVPRHRLAAMLASHAVFLAASRRRRRGRNTCTSPEPGPRDEADEPRRRTRLNSTWTRAACAASAGGLPSQLPEGPKMGDEDDLNHWLRRHSSDLYMSDPEVDVEDRPRGARDSTAATTACSARSPPVRSRVF